LNNEEGDEADDESEDKKGVVSKICGCISKSKTKNSEEDDGGSSKKKAKKKKKKKKSMDGDDEDDDDDDSDDDDKGLLGKISGICKCRKPKIGADDEDSEKHGRHKKKGAKRLHKHKHEWHSQFYTAGLVYAVYEPTSRAALLGSGQCTECTEEWIWFGIATAGSLIAPALLLLHKRFMHKVVAFIKQAKKNKKETGSYFDSAS